MATGCGSATSSGSSSNNTINSSSSAVSNKCSNITASNSSGITNNLNCQLSGDVETQFLDNNRLTPTSGITTAANTAINYLSSDCYNSYGQSSSNVNNNYGLNSYQSLKIKTKSIENTLLPLVNQVSIQFI